MAQECRMDDLDKTLLSPAMLPQRKDMQFPDQASKFEFERLQKRFWLCKLNELLSR